MFFQAFLDSDLQAEIYIFKRVLMSPLDKLVNIFIGSYKVKQKKGY